MSVTKRRAEAPSEQRAGKKQKSDKPLDKPSKQREEPQPAQAVSVLRDEEAAFPRGGANILSPLERRQIQIKAKEDVLFEQKTGKKAPTSLGLDDEDDDEEDDLAVEEEQSSAKPGKKDKKSKSKDKKTKKKPSEQVDSGPRIEGLSYKRLVVGSIVLGQVTSINKYDVTVALPNSLVGYLPLTAISDKVTQAVEAIAAQEDDDEDDGDEDGELKLQDYLRVGQYLRACVTKVGADGDSAKDKSKRHISLSAIPHQVNDQLTKADLVVDNVVQASIESVEDHGVIMSVGLEDEGIKGFMSAKEIPSEVKLSELKAGAVMLCLVLGLNPNGKTVKLSANLGKIGNLKKGGFLQDGPSVDTFLPGCAVEILVSEVTESGLIGKVMGLLDVTADWIHSTRDLEQKPLAKRHPVGSQAKARVICTFPSSESKKLGVSLLPHILSLSTQQPKQSDKHPTSILPISSTVKEAKVINVEPKSGLILDLGVKGVPGYAHISRLSDENVSTLSADSGTYKTGSVHRARIVGYNSIDGQFVASLQQSALEAAFLQLEDVPVGEVVKGTVEKVYINAAGQSSVLLKLAEGIVGRVSESHLSDVQLHNPEKKFKEGSKISARVLNVDLERRRIDLTCKKSLLNSDAAVWKTYADPKIGELSPGTIIKILPAGAIVQYYGKVKGFLPTSQMSESFVKDPTQHFKVGQVVTTHPLNIDTAEEKMTVSCRDPSSFGPKQQKSLEELESSSLVSGIVSEKTPDKLVIELDNSGLKATLTVDHLADGSSNKCANAAKKIRVGQKMQSLLVLSKNLGSQIVHLSNKPSLLKAQQAGQFPSRLEDLEIGEEIAGFISNVTDNAIFVKFADGLTGLLHRSGVADELAQLPNFGLRQDATITAKVSSVDATKRRFTLTQKEIVAEQKSEKETGTNGIGRELVNPVDGQSQTTAEFKVGFITKAKITSVKDTQINVDLADGVRGRIDVSQVFDSWDEITNRKAPLSKFNSGQVLPVRILGQHAHRDHRFLPLTHAGKTKVFELTARPSDLKAKELVNLTVDKVNPGEEHLCFVNNVRRDLLYVNLTPNVRGRIKAMDASDNVSHLSNLEEHFPVGSSLRARVLSVDAERGLIDLSATSTSRVRLETISDVKEGLILPGKVTRVTERQIMVQLSEALSAPVNLVELDDDFSKADPTKFEKGQIIRVYVSGVDVPNKKLTLSTRHSKTLSSTLKVADPEIKSASQVQVNDIVRGFVKNIAENGVFVALSSSVTAFVPVRELSDKFIKDWKSDVELDKLVKGRIIAVDAAAGKVQLSLKASKIDKNYKAPLSWHELKAGQIVTGKVKKVVDDLGVFIQVDNSDNVSGLCHKSQMADEKVVDIKKLYIIGDAVKAVVLRVDLSKPKRELAFGLKASYFKDSEAMDVDDEDDDENDSDTDSDEGVQVPDANEDDESEDDSDGSPGFDDLDVDSEDDSDGEGMDITAAIRGKSDRIPTTSNGLSIGGLMAGGGLNVGGFNWNGKRSQDEVADHEEESESEAEPKKKKRRKAQIQVDRTAELDINGPQSPADFERLLMSEPNSSALWLGYMAYYLQLNEITKARDIAERAIKIVNHQRKDTEEEALNIWVGYLNLENAYGSDETVDAVFARAKQYNDEKEIHSQLASIYIQSAKTERADALLQAMIKHKKLNQDPAVWLNYAAFLFDTAKQPVQARELLKRAQQALPADQHFDVVLKFAQLEFKSQNGNPELGRTMIEKLIGTFEKRLDLYNVYLDLEIKIGDKDTVRRLFQKATSSSKLKPKQAKYFFKRWDEWEQKNGDAKSVEKVKAKAEDWVRKHMEKANKA